MYCQKCGLKLPEGARECDICGHSVAAVNRGMLGWIVAVFILLTAVAFLAGKQAQSPVTAVAANPNSQAQIPTEPASVETEPASAESEPASAESEPAPAESEPASAEFEPVTAPQTASEIEPSTADLMAQVNPPEGFQRAAVYGDLGPMLLEAGAIDYDRFVQTYERAGRPLTDTQLAILTASSDEPILINQENAYFLLNFFWAVGLTNQNTLLTEGLMTQRSEGNVGRYASTGGWTIGQKPATELYASTPLIALTPEQQALVEQVAAKVYRPCCNNHTAFPDCNHGMAMLGLLELMAAQGASEDEMFTAAKYMSAAWFPQQAMETAVFFKATMDLDYADVDGRMAVGPEVFSSSGFQEMHQWLAEGGELPQAPQGGNSCGV